MDKLVLHNTPVAQWHSLINEAGSYAGLRLEEDVESYLVFLLMRFSTNVQLSKSVVALDYLESIQSESSRQYEQLRGVGDKCLLFAGLFPGLAERKHVRLGYYVKIGQSAYYTVAGLIPQKSARLYELLSRRFISLIEILHNARELNSDLDCLTPLQAIEFWQDTSSQQAVDKMFNSADKTLLFSLKDSKTRH